MLIIIADIFFTIFHTFLIIFNITGWIFKKTRLINFISLFLTGISWSILGIFYGFGYCPLTDWHFTILNKLGYNNLPDSYISFLILRILSIRVNQNLVDFLTLLFFLISFTISFILNFKMLAKFVKKIKLIIFKEKNYE